MDQAQVDPKELCQQRSAHGSLRRIDHDRLATHLRDRLIRRFGLTQIRSEIIGPRNLLPQQSNNVLHAEPLKELEFLLQRDVACDRRIRAAALPRLANASPKT